MTRGIERTFPRPFSETFRISKNEDFNGPYLENENEFLKNSFETVFRASKSCDRGQLVSAFQLTFKNELIKCIRSSERSTSNIDGILGIKLVTRLRLGFSHLREHTHHYNFPVSPICACGTEPETTKHFHLRSQRFSQIRSDILNNAYNITKTDVNLLCKELLTKFLLYGDHTFNDISNQLILQATVTFISLSERFEIEDSSRLYIYMMDG